MTAILWNYWRQFIYYPWRIIGYFMFTVVIACTIGQTAVTNSEVPVYVEEMSKQETADMLNVLNQQSHFSFVLHDRAEVNEQLEVQKINFAFELMKDDFRFLVAAETREVHEIYAYMTTFYQEKQLFDDAAERLSLTSNEVRAEVDQMLAEPAYSVDKSVFHFDMELQALFGYSLYFIILTISFTISKIVYEKQYGLWDRLILSPLQKTRIYLGNFLFSFFLGYVKTALLFSLFYYVFDVDFYGGFWLTLVAIVPYIFAIISLGVLLSSFVTNMKQMNVVISLVSATMATVGGAYWPLEVVGSEVMLFISKFSPITYGMELLKGVTFNQASIEELLFPASVLILMGVVFMGIGVNVMERKDNR